MTLSAKYNEEIYYSPEIEEDFGKNNKFTCICCKQELIFHRDICGIKTQHWNHKSNCNYETEPESKEHIIKKKWLYDNISDIYKKYKPDSIMIGDQKPDILLELVSQKVAVEIQCSSISYEKWLERTKKYAKKGIFVFWVFGQNFLENMEGNEKRISRVEKEIHYLNYGRNYYLITDDEWMSIQPIHFKSVMRVTNPCDTCHSDFPCDNCQYGEMKYSFPKTIKKMEFHTKTYKKGLKLHLFENNGLKLAKLSDYTFWEKVNNQFKSNFNQPISQTNQYYKGKSFGQSFG